MAADIKVSKNKIYLIERNEDKVWVKNQRKIFMEAEKNLRKILIGRLKGKNGDC